MLLLLCGWCHQHNKVWLSWMKWCVVLCPAHEPMLLICKSKEQHSNEALVIKSKHMYPNVHTYCIYILYTCSLLSVPQSKLETSTKSSVFMSCYSTKCFGCVKLSQLVNFGIAKQFLLYLSNFDSRLSVKCLVCCHVVLC